MAPGLLALGQPDPHPQAMAAIGERGEEIRVLLAPGEQVVAGQQPLGRAVRASIALQAGSRTSVSSGRSCPVNIVAIRS